MPAPPQGLAAADPNAPPTTQGPIAGPSNYRSPDSSPHRNEPTISVDEFCTRYNISPTDQERLVKLEFQPGDRNVTKLPREDWAEYGFTTLSWGRVVDANKKYMRSLK